MIQKYNKKEPGKTWGVKVEPRNTPKIYCPVCLQMIHPVEDQCSYCSWKVEKYKLLDTWPMINDMRACIRRLYMDWIADAGEKEFCDWCRDRFLKKGLKSIKTNHYSLYKSE